MGILVNKIYGKTGSMTSIVQAKAVYKGSLKVYKMYAGSNLVWHEDDNDEPDIPDIPDIPDEPDPPTESVTYGVPVTISVNYSDIAANGEGGAITVNWEQTKNTYSGNALVKTETLQGTSGASTVSGKEQVSGSGYANGKLYAPNCGMVSSDRRLVYKTNLITYIANGISANITTEYEVYQEANIFISEEETNINIELEVDRLYLERTGGTVVATPTCTSTYVYEYTSGVYNIDSSNTVKISAPDAAIGSNVDVPSGKGTTIVYGANESKEPLNRRITAEYNGLYAIKDVSQYGTAYEFSKQDDDLNITSRSQTVYVRVKSLKEESPLEITDANVSLSGITGAKINNVAKWDDNGVYAVFIDIPENTSDQIRTLTVSITQPDSGSKIQYSILQKVAVVTETIDDPTVGSLSYSTGTSTISANGEGALISVNWERIKHIYKDGEASSTKTLTGTSPLTSAVITELVTGSGYNITEGLYAPNRKNEEGQERDVLTITSVTYEIDEKSFTNDVDYTITQQSNTSSSTFIEGKLKLSSNKSEIGVNGGSIDIEVSAYEKYNVVWTSLYEEETTTSLSNVTVQVTGATFAQSGPTAILNDGDKATITVEANGGAVSRTIKIAASVGTYTDSINITQKGSDYEFAVEGNMYGDLTHKESDCMYLIKSTKNDFEHPFTIDNVSTDETWISIDDVTKYNLDGTIYAVRFTVAANLAREQRSGTITVIQPVSNAKLELDVVQPAYKDPVITYGWGDPVIDSISIDDVSANGTGKHPTVKYTQSYYEYSDGEITQTTTTSYTANITGLKGTALITGAGYDTTNGVYAPNRLTTAGDRRQVYKITAVSYTSNSVSVQNAAVDHIVYQSANVFTVSNTTISNTLTGQPNSLPRLGGTVQLTPTATSSQQGRWSSGEVDTRVQKLTVTIDGDHKATFNGTATAFAESGQTITATVGEYVGISARTITFTSTYTTDTNTYSDTFEVTQAGSEYSISANTAVPNESSAAAFVGYCVVTSVKNGNAFPFTLSNVSIDSAGSAWLSIDDIGVYSQTDNSYIVEFSADKNNSADLRIATVTITQPESNKKTSFTVKQLGNSVSTSYDTPVVTQVIGSDVNADGTGSTIQLKISQNKIVTSTNGDVEKTPISSTVSPTSVKSTQVVNGSGYSASTGLYGPNRQDQVGDRRLILNITEVSFQDVNNNKSTTASVSYSVYQKANAVESRTPYGDPSITLSGDTSTNIATDGGTFTFTVSCTGTDKILYTSNYEGTGISDRTATLSVYSINEVSINNSSVTGYAVVTGTVGHNASAIANNIRIVATSGNISKEITFKQSPFNYELLLHSLTSNAPAEGGNASFVVKSTKNDNSYPISTSNVSVTGLSGASILDVTQNSEDPTLYHVRVNMPENTATTTRTATVTITHPFPSLKTLTVTVTQNAAANNPVGGTVTIKGTNNLGIIDYSMTIESGTYDSLEIRAAAGNSTSATVHASVIKENVSAGTHTGRLRGVPTSGTVWVLVLHNGDIIANSVAMASENPPEIIG